MQNKIITVFGGSGFLGRHVIQRLAQQGARVRVAVRNTDKANHVRIYGDVGQVMPVQVCLSDQTAIESVCAGAHSVINLTGRFYEKGASTFEAVHVKGAHAIAKACAQQGVENFVHVSAIGAHKKALSEYARTKALGEEKIHKAFPKAIILRPSLMFGEGDSFFGRFAGLATFLPCLMLFRRGTPKFQPVYVGDVARALMSALQTPEAQGTTYELGGPKIYTLKDLMTLILRYTNRDKPLLSLPTFMDSLLAKVCQVMPNPLITPDQLKSLKSDSIVAENAKTLMDLGITAVHLEAIVPGYLVCYKSRF